MTDWAHIYMHEVPAPEHSGDRQEDLLAFVAASTGLLPRPIPQSSTAAIKAAPSSPDDLAAKMRRLQDILEAMGFVNIDSETDVPEIMQ